MGREAVFYGIARYDLGYRSEHKMSGYDDLVGSAGLPRSG
jgi:hypothetical protein